MLCPFCLPQVSKTIFAASDNFQAIYNIAPILPGHTLIIPKTHLTSILELSDSHLFEMMNFSKKIIRFLKQEFSCEAFDFTIQDGSAAGQTIEHLHVHIVPRQPNDLIDPGDWYPEIMLKQEEMLDSFSRKKISDEHMLKIINHLKSEYNAFIVKRQD